jgi:hypothetical protein
MLLASFRPQLVKDKRADMTTALADILSFILKIIYKPIAVIRPDVSGPFFNTVVQEKRNALRFPLCYGWTQSVTVMMDFLSLKNPLTQNNAVETIRKRQHSASTGEDGTRKFNGF